MTNPRYKMAGIITSSIKTNINALSHYNSESLYTLNKSINKEIIESNASGKYLCVSDIK